MLSWSAAERLTSLSQDIFDSTASLYYTTSMAVPVPKMPADWELTPAPEDADPFRYGWRPRYVHLPNGEVEEEQIPLTAEDLLDPQPGDVVLEDQPHANVTSFLHVLLDVLFETDVLCSLLGGRRRIRIPRGTSTPTLTRTPTPTPTRTPTP